MYLTQIELLFVFVGIIIINFILYSVSNVTHLKRLHRNNQINTK